MIFSPSNISPKNTSFDATADKLITWTNKGTLQQKYKVLIKNNNTSADVYDTGEVTSAINSHTLPSNSLSNGTDYKYTIQVWGIDSTTATSNYNYISCHATPVTTFTNPVFSATPVTINSQNFTFQISYTQAQTVGLKSYRIILYDSTGTTILDDSGELYDYLLQYEVVGMTRGTSYKIYATVTANDDLTSNTGQKDIVIANYTLPDDTPVLNVTENNNDGTVEIDWADLKIITPVVTGGYSYVAGKFYQGLQLDVASEIQYNETFEDDGYSFTYWTKLSYGQNGDFMQIGDNVFIGYDSTLLKFYHRVDSTYTYSDVITLYTWEDFQNSTLVAYASDTWNNISFTSTDFIYTWLFIGVTPDEVTILFNNEQRVLISLT